jgi:hypothetical protein
LFFTRVRSTAEQASRPEQALLRRQALYLAGYDEHSDTAPWMAEQQKSRVAPGWLNAWLNARSVASVAARYGDTDRIRDFIDRTLVNQDQGEAANLNYWAYWVGETAVVEPDDAFIAVGLPGAWAGRALLRHLSERLRPSLGFGELYVHTLWALLAARPQLLRSPGADVDGLRHRVGVLLDGPGLSPQARSELDGIRYAIRLAQA